MSAPGIRLACAMLIYCSGSQTWVHCPLGEREEIPRVPQRDHLVETIVLMFISVLATISIILNFNFLMFFRLYKILYKCI